MSIMVQISDSYRKRCLSSSIHTCIAEISVTIAEIDTQQISRGLSVPAGVRPDSRIDEIKMSVGIDVSQHGGTGHVSFPDFTGLCLECAVAVTRVNVGNVEAVEHQNIGAPIFVYVSGNHELRRDEEAVVNGLGFLELSGAIINEDCSSQTRIDDSDIELAILLKISDGNRLRELQSEI